MGPPNVFGSSTVEMSGYCFILFVSRYILQKVFQFREIKFFFVEKTN